MTNEITAALAKVRDLRVVGRSSAFQFKGQNRDLRAVGQSLGTTHLIEGSVRKVSARVRITVQVVRADNGLHVWAETYERELGHLCDPGRDCTSNCRLAPGAARASTGWDSCF
jgi:TolB-like protein